MGHEFGLLAFVNVFILLSHYLSCIVSSEPAVPCYFILGDSLVDSGNNNELRSKWKANYPPYGIDFPDGATGRFSNGRTSADIIGQFLGFDGFIPSFTKATDEDFIRGVNYASGGCGIREETGSHNGERISLDRQLRNHMSTISRLSRLQQNTTILKECIYLVNIGSNDYINNYLIPEHYNTSRLYTTHQYADVLMEQYSKQLRTLYRMGGRKVALFGLTQLGCTPLSTSKFDTEGQACVKMINIAVNLFNHKFKSLVDELNDENPDATFTFINTSNILYPQGETGLRTPPCCQLSGEWACTPKSLPCPFRVLSIFYDALHPCEVSNTVIATRAYHALIPTDAYPYDIYNLARLKLE